MSALQKNKSFDFLKQNAIYFVLLILLGIIIAQIGRASCRERV